MLMLAKQRNLKFKSLPFSLLKKPFKVMKRYNVLMCAILCVEDRKRDHSLNVILESRIDNSCYIQKTIYRVDSNNLNVKVKQMYMDKANLMVVMTKYKIDHSLNF